MKKEYKEILTKLEEAQRMLERETKTQKGLEDAFCIIEQCNPNIHTPEGGLLAFLLREYRQHHETFKTSFHLLDMMSCINEVIGRITKLAEEPTPIAEKIKSLDEKPTEIKKVIVEATSEPTIKNYRKRSRKNIRGHRILGKMARKVETDYSTTLTQERYMVVLNAIALHPKSSFETIVRSTGLPKNGVYAHIRYGQQIRDIVIKKSKYQLRQNGIVALNKLKNQFGETKMRNLKKSSMAKVKGTYLTDKDALYIHMHYDSPVVKERYEKLKHILESHFGLKAKIEEIIALTGWSKNNTKAHIMYGVRIGEIASCGQHDGEYQYCLKKNLEKAKPKKEVRISEMY